MSGEIPIAIAEAARLAMAILEGRKAAKADLKEGKYNDAQQKEKILQAANDAWDRGDLSSCADHLAGMQDTTATGPDSGN